MSNRDYVKMQIDALPDGVVERVMEFIAFQKFALGIYDSDTDYLTAIPGMVESIKSAAAEPLSSFVPVSELWPDV